MLSDAELCTVPELVGPGGDHSMPRARCRRIIDESRLRSEFPEYTAQDDLRRQMVQAFRDAEAVDDFDSLRDTFTSKITGIICAGDEQTLAAFGDLIEDTSISCEVIGIALEAIGCMWPPRKSS